MTDQFVLMLLLVAHESIENPQEYVQQHKQRPTHQAQWKKPKPKLQKRQQKRKNNIHQPR